MLDKSAPEWLRGRRESDSPPDERRLWRIHGQLYDLSAFAARHPGGAEFLELTRGTDATAAFEAHHVHIERARRVLGKFRVRAARDPPPAFFSFDEAGFFCAVRRRLAARGGDVGPTAGMRALCWGVVAAALAGVAATLHWQSWPLALLTGNLLFQCMGVGHNFFHQSDANWLRFAMDLTTAASFDFRQSHALSHHLVPNTTSDFEVSALEPMLYFLRSSPRAHWAAPLYANAVFALGMPLDCAIRWIHIAAGRRRLRWENLLLPAQLALAAAWRGWPGVALLALSHAVASLQLFSVGIIVHHHPSCWADGDAPVLDFGEHQLRAARDHSVHFPLWASLACFGLFNNHVVHHLFPCVDASRVPELRREVLLPVCREFGLAYEVGTFWGSYKGMWGMVLSSAD